MVLHSRVTALVRILTALAMGSISAEADVLLDWNALMLDAIRTDNSPPTLAARNLAILHTAIYDSVNSIVRTHQAYRFLQPAPAGASEESAVVAAAHEVLLALYPSFRARADELQQSYQATTPPTAARTNGFALGSRIAKLTIESRQDDGASTQLPYIPEEEPGQWRRTPPFFRPPLDPQWGFIRTFCLDDPDAFLPPGPPPLESAAYAADFQLVKELGARNSPSRTPEQSQSAVFWSDFSYTVTPPGHWQQIAAAIARTSVNRLAENARLFALLSLAQADAAVVTWNAKYRDNFWRPVTAIRRADEDGNPATAKDETWESFLVTPSFPEYTSGHSTFSGASATVLAQFYGTDAMSFTVGSDAMPGVYRSFTSLWACAEEIGMSRIYGGIHFMSANRDGKASGKKIADFVAQNFLLANDSLPRVRLERLAANGVQIRVHGHIGSTCVLEASDDLAHWSPISTNAASVGGVVIMDSSSVPIHRRFYRVRENGSR